MLKFNYVCLEKKSVCEKFLDLKFDTKKLTSSKFLSFEKKDLGKIFYFSSSQREDFIKFFFSDISSSFSHCVIDDIFIDDINDVFNIDLTCINYIDSNILFSAERVYVS